MITRNRAWYEHLMLPVMMAAGIALSLHYGRTGFMPLDHSIVFDGAWRILSGQVPYRDFTTPNGIVPMLMQAGFFRLLGVNWFAYCLHAALLNGLFCLLAYALLRLLQAPRWLAFVAGLLSGVVYYPPLGTPYLEQHGFFFVLLAVVMAVTAARRAHGFAWWLLWTAVPAVLILGLLSKQIPAVFGFPLVIGVALVMEKKRRGRALLALTAGTAAGAALAWGAAAAAGVQAAQVRVFAFELPSALGRERLAKLLADPAALTESFTWPFRHRIKVWRGTAAYTVFAAFVLTPFFAGYGLLLLVRRGGKRVAEARRRARALLPEVALAAGLVLTCWLTATFTDNLQENNIPFVYIALAVAWLATARALLGDTDVSAETVSERRLFAVRSASLAFLMVAAFDAYMFNNQINAGRLVHDFVYDARRFRPYQRGQPAELAFMKWGAPGAYAYLPGELKAVSDHIRSRTGGLFVLGDASVFYALTGRASTNPVLWFHVGLTMPRPGTELFDRYEQRLLDNFRRHDVRFIIVEGKQTWLGVKLADYRRLGELIAGTPHRDTVFGHVRLIELNPAGDPAVSLPDYQTK